MNNTATTKQQRKNFPDKALVEQKSQNKGEAYDEPLAQV